MSRLTDVFVVREGTSTGGATDTSRGSAKFRPSTDPDLEDVDTSEDDLERFGEGSEVSRQRADRVLRSHSVILPSSELDKVADLLDGATPPPGKSPLMAVYAIVVDNVPSEISAVRTAKAVTRELFKGQDRLVRAPIEEAGPGDASVVKGLGIKTVMGSLAKTPWKPSSRTLNDDETRFRKALEGVHCFVSVMPSILHSHHTNRGAGYNAEGWMLDCEIRTREGDLWVFHTEKRFEYEDDALQAQQDVMKFVDRHTLKSLLDVPRSGQISMTAWGNGGPR